MPVDAGKRAALIDEGMTEGEADFMLSGGAKSEGLTPPVADSGAAAPVTAEPAKPAVADAPAAGAAPAAQATPAAAPAAVEDDEPEPAKDSPYYPQWKREKHRRQELQTELRTRDTRLAETTSALTDLQTKWARLDERFSVFREAATAQPEAAKVAAEPDIEADPFGWMKWAKGEITTLKGQTEQTATTVQETNAATELQTSYINDARTFARATPDFGLAYNWLMANRDAELKAAGYGDPAERMRIIALDERDIVARALKGRQDNPQSAGPAQIIYGLAKARGFTPSPAGAQQSNGAAPANGAASTNGATQPNGAVQGANGAAPTNAAQTVTQQVETIQRGQAASRSLSSAGGSPAPTGIDLQAIADMSDEAYLEWRRMLTPGQIKEYGALIGAPKSR